MLLGVLAHVICEFLHLQYECRWCVVRVRVRRKMRMQEEEDAGGGGGCRKRRMQEEEGESVVVNELFLRANTSVMMLRIPETARGSERGRETAFGWIRIH